MQNTCCKEIRETPRKEYVDELNHRVIQLLLRYKSLADIKSNILLNEVFGWRFGISDADVYVDFISEGNIELEEAETKALAKYIANVFGYDFKSFYNAVKFGALYYEPSSYKKTNLQRQIVAIGKITSEL